MTSVTSNIIWWIEDRTLKEIIVNDDLLSLSSSSPSSSSSASSHLTQEQYWLLNFDEIVALWYFILAIWYGFFKFQNWKRSRTTSTTTTIVNNNIQYGFSPIHWLILFIAIMGLANFLFSVRVLQVMGRRSSIGGRVLKLSYANMFLACFRHPCTLSLGVMAPKVFFSSDRNYYFSSADGGESIKSTTIFLVVLSCAQVIVRLTESLTKIFMYGQMAGLEYVLDEIFLVWMIYVLYNTTIEISRDEYYGHGVGVGGGGIIRQNRWQLWWKSPGLIFFWISYTIFVTVSTILVLIGMSSFFGGTENYIYADSKVHATNDLLLLTGIAIVLRPKPIEHYQYEIFHSDLNNDNEGGISSTDIDYSLLPIEREDNTDCNNEEGLGEETTFEMITNTSSSNEVIGDYMI